MNEEMINTIEGYILKMKSSLNFEDNYSKCNWLLTGLEMLNENITNYRNQITELKNNKL